MRGISQENGALLMSVERSSASGAPPRLSTVTLSVLDSPTVTSPKSITDGSGAMSVTLNFGSERDARAFAAALSEPPLWIGRARVLCAD